MGVTQAGIVTGDTLCPGLSVLARKRGLGARVTEKSSCPKRKN